MQFSFQSIGRTLQLHLTLTEEEEAIIRHRSLHSYVFDIAPGCLPHVHMYKLVLVASVAAFILSIPLSIISSIANNQVLGLFSGLMLIGSPCAFAYAVWSMWAQRHISESKLTLGYILDHRSLTINTPDPKQLPIVENNILRRLENLKTFLVQTHDLVQKRTFEL